MSIAKTAIKKIQRINLSDIEFVNDTVAIEEPLEIRVEHGNLTRQTRNISVTMRTPANDEELSIGFLFTEGIISDIKEVVSVVHEPHSMGNIITVSLQPQVEISLQNTERNFYTTSSCGVCGKASVDAVKTVKKVATFTGKQAKISEDVITSLPPILRSRQQVFNQTGGLHGCGLFTTAGELLLAREDVGRHNALDKLIGAALQQQLLPLHNYILLLSGRASFELIQKAWMAGITTVAAVGAPSSLAVELAVECNITLIGFLRNSTFNVYNGEQHLQLNSYETSYKG